MFEDRRARSFYVEAEWVKKPRHGQVMEFLSFKWGKFVGGSDTGMGYQELARRIRLRRRTPAAVDEGAAAGCRRGSRTGRDSW